MPVLGASVVALLAGWAIDAVTGLFLDSGAQFVVSLIGSTAAFVWAVRWLRRLRDG